MGQLFEMPKDGQFVAVWEYNGALWSYTLRWSEDQLQIYHSSRDLWENICKSYLMFKYTFYRLSSCVNISVGAKVVVEEEQKYTFNINTELDIDWKKIGEDCTIDNQVLLITNQKDTYIRRTFVISVRLLFNH